MNSQPFSVQLNEIADFEEELVEELAGVRN
jgi:hypothetical protein